MEEEICHAVYNRAGYRVVQADSPTFWCGAIAKGLSFLMCLRDVTIIGILLNHSCQ